MGKRNRPFYRIVVADARAPRDGKYIECIGYYDPIKSDNFKLDVQKYEEWIKKGAQPTDRVLSLYRRAKKEGG